MFFQSNVPLKEVFENPIPLEITELILLCVQGLLFLAYLASFVIYIAKRKKKFELNPLDHLEHDFNLATSPYFFFLSLLIPFRNVVHFELTLFDETFRYGVTPADLIAFLFGYREEGIDELMEMIDVSSVELISELPGKLQFSFFAPLVLLIVLFVFLVISISIESRVRHSHHWKEKSMLLSPEEKKASLRLLGILFLIPGVLLISHGIVTYVNIEYYEEATFIFWELLASLSCFIISTISFILSFRPTEKLQPKLNEYYATPADACKALRRATFLSYGAFCGYCLFSVILCAVARNYIEEEMGGWLDVTVGNELLLPFLLATLYTVLFILGSSSTKPLLDRLFSRPEPAPAIVPQISPRLAEQANVALLQEYKKLLDNGVITEEEFQKKKDDILNR